MSQHGRVWGSCRVWWFVGLVPSLVLAGATCMGAEAGRADWKPIKGLMCNIDDSVFFWGSTIEDGKAGETIDRYVDVMAGAGTTVLLCNINARRTNYRSKVWDAYWDGYDPKGSDDQPFLAPMPRDEVASYRKGIGNALAVYEQGVDYPARMVERCRHDGISPWISLRMNDCHYNHISDHPFHGSFWRKNPQFARQNCPGYFATCLDYAHQEVRQYFMSLIDEALERFDMDGLELDFMRECYLFSAGKEAEGRPILTEWMREVRKHVNAAAVKRGHAIQLGVRVPSRPEVSLALGLDAVGWAKEGIVDVLVVTPRWTTIEFDMPLEKWREMLGSAPVTLAGGLEIRYQPAPGGPASIVSAELAAGAAIEVLSRGADVVYLFNYFQNSHPFWEVSTYQRSLKAMTSLATLLQTPRTIGITYRDITAPGEAYRAPLPAEGKELVFPMRVGPVPGDGWHCQLLAELGRVGDAAAVPAVSVNGKPCELLKDDAAEGGRRVAVFKVPLADLRGTDVQQVKISSKDQNSPLVYRVERLEVSFAPNGR